MKGVAPSPSVVGIWNKNLLMHAWMQQLYACKVSAKHSGHPTSLGVSTRNVGGTNPSERRSSPRCKSARLLPKGLRNELEKGGCYNWESEMNVASIVQCVGACSNKRGTARWTTRSVGNNMKKINWWRKILCKGNVCLRFEASWVHSNNVTFLVVWRTVSLVYCYRIAWWSISLCEPSNVRFQGIFAKGRPSGGLCRRLGFSTKRNAIAS